MRITDLLKQEGILLNAAPASKAEAIEMLISLHDKCGSLNDVAAFKEGILKREEMGTRNARRWAPPPSAWRSPSPTQKAKQSRLPL